MPLGDPQRPDIEGQIRALLSKASDATSAYRPQYLNRAGDLAASAGDVQRALVLWGQAIDGYLEVSRPDAAAAACRKVIRGDPRVVRAHRTLTLLSIGFGHLDEAARHLRTYLDAAQAAGRKDLAINQLYIMARVCADNSFILQIADTLEELGDSAGSAMWRLLASHGSVQPLGLDAPDRWAAILHAAHMTPDEVARESRLPSNESERPRV
jgi:tetratricopeptide (TPR) repeat protein